MNINLLKLLLSLRQAGVKANDAAAIISRSIDSTSHDDLLQAVGKCYQEVDVISLMHAKGYINNVIVELGQPRYNTEVTLPHCKGWQS